MASGSILGQQGIAAELAAALPVYDPLAPRRDGATTRRLILLSLAIHLALLMIFWHALIGVVIDEEGTVVVRMVDEPKPEPPKLKRKVLAQRRVDASVRQFKDVVQPEIRQVRPVPVLAQTQKVEVDPLRLTQAPKQIQNRKVVTRHVDAFAERPVQVQPIEAAQEVPSVRHVQSARASAGPRVMEAAGPRVDARAVEVEAPVMTRGEISESAVEGDLKGARIAAIESGTAERFLRGDGESGRVSGLEKECAKDPVCLAYLKLIRDRVYARWSPGLDITAGSVKLRFQVDRGGSAHGIRIVQSDDALLGEACELAFRQASPFPPPPKEIHYLVTKGIIATFFYGTESGG